MHYCCACVCAQNNYIIIQRKKTTTTTKRLFVPDDSFMANTDTSMLFLITIYSKFLSPCSQQAIYRVHCNNDILFMGLFKLLLHTPFCCLVFCRQINEVIVQQRLELLSPQKLSLSFSSFTWTRTSNTGKLMRAAQQKGYNQKTLRNFLGYFKAPRCSQSSLSNYCPAAEMIEGRVYQ